MTHYDGLDEVRKLFSISVAALNLDRVELSAPRPVEFDVVRDLLQWPSIPRDDSVEIVLTFRATAGEANRLRALPVAILDLFHAAEPNPS